VRENMEFWTPLRKKAMAVALAIIGAGGLAYGAAVIIMADTLVLGGISFAACCLPFTMICWVLAFVLWREAR